jgi:hypothetical protein
MSKVKQATQYSIDYDRGFQEGMRDGHAGRCSNASPAMVKAYRQGYEKGYSTGYCRAAKYNTPQVEKSSSAPFNPWQYST